MRAPAAAEEPAEAPVATEGVESGRPQEIIMPDRKSGRSKVFLKKLSSNHVLIAPATAIVHSSPQGACLRRRLSFFPDCLPCRNRPIMAKKTRSLAAAG